MRKVSLADWRWDLSLVSLKLWGRFFMHVRVVATVDEGVPASAALGVVMAMLLL